jgi:uncharacterized membrane protein YccC
MQAAKLDPYVRQTVRIMLACGLADCFSILAGLSEGYWALITAVVVTQPAFDDTLIASRNRVLGTLIGAGMGFLVLEATHHGGPLYPLFWAALAPLAVLTAIRQSLRLSCITLIVVVLIPSSGAAFERPLDRVFGILLGTLGAILAAACIRSAGKAAP